MVTKSAELPNWLRKVGRSHDLVRVLVAVSAKGEPAAVRLFPEFLPHVGAIAGILWHTRRGMTAHYSVAQIKELVEALERITDERSRTNRSLEMIRREQVGKRSPQFLPTESKKANLAIGLSA